MNLGDYQQQRGGTAGLASSSEDVRNHGTASSYNNLGCRCDECRAAASAARQAWVQSLQNRKFADVPHGTPSGYRNWGCRCEQCTLVRAAEAREQQRRKRAKGA